MKFISIYFYVGLFLSALPLSSQCIYKGKVIDLKTSEPLVGVSISIKSGAFSTTNLNGEYHFERPCDENEFIFSFIGYEEKVISGMAETDVIRLSSSSTVLNQVIVSANRYSQDRSAAPIAISTISPEMLEETKPTRLDEVLNKVEGVYMVDLGSEQHTMAIRHPINYKGLFLYLEDGIPIRPTGVFNHNALLEMNMTGLSRIEVIRGPASSSYGSEAIGGAINFITLRPAAVPTGRLSVQGNNNEYRRLDFIASNTLGKLGMGVYGYYANRKNGIRAHSDYDKLALTFKANYILDDRHTLGFDVTNIDYYADMTGGVDSAFFFKKDYSSQHTFTNRAVDALRAKLTYNYFGKEDSKTTITAFARSNSIRQNPSYNVKDDYSPWRNPSGNRNLAHGEVNVDKVHSYGLFGQHSHSLHLLHGSKLSLGTNLDVSPDHYRSNYIAIEKSKDQIYTGYTKSDSVLTDYSALLINIGAYLNWDVKITDQWQFTAAMRYDQLNFDFNNNLDENAFSGALNAADNFSALTPKLGMTYNFKKGNGLFLNYSQGFLPPQISELYRGVKIPVLQPSVYENFEMGGYFQFGHRFSFDLGVYLMNGKNEIISVLLDDGSRENRNAGKTQHKGIEYGLRWKMVKDLSLRISGSNASHVFKKYIESGNDYSENEMGQAPFWIANSELTYKPNWLKNFRASLEWQHVGTYFMDNGNTGRYPGYDVFNLRLSYSIRAVELWINTINITNELYATVVRRSQWGDSYNAGEPRVFNIGLAYNFHKNRDVKSNEYNETEYK